MVRTGKIGFLLLVILVSLKGSMPAYQLYTDNGDKVSFEKLVQEAEEADVVLFGEQHNNAIAHWLELELAKALYDKKGKKLMVGAEMLERDDQQVLNEYLNGLTKQKHFEKEAKLWDNYETDYKPLVKLAKAEGLPFFATNIPRRYANYVAYNGPKSLDTFGQFAGEYFPELPIKMNMELEAYQKIKKMGMHASKMDYMAEAQAVKDATMAYTILENWQKDHVFLHVNGNFHARKKGGIYWYLKDSNPELSVLTIKTVAQENVGEFNTEHEGKGDFIIATPSDMTKTY